MMAVEEAADRLRGPAESAEELFERLEPHIGELVRIEWSGTRSSRDQRGYRASKLTARLSWLQVVEAAQVISLGLEGVAEPRKISLNQTISVRVGAGWKDIHRPLKEETP